MQETSVDQNDEGLIRGYNKYSDLTDICMAEMQVVITIESIHERDFKSGGVGGRDGAELKALVEL